MILHRKTILYIVAGLALVSGVFNLILTDLSLAIRVDSEIKEFCRNQFVPDFNDSIDGDSRYRKLDAEEFCKEDYQIDYFTESIMRDGRPIGAHYSPLFANPDDSTLTNEIIAATLQKTIDRYNDLFCAGLSLNQGIHFLDPAGTCVAKDLDFNALDQETKDLNDEIAASCQVKIRNTSSGATALRILYVSKQSEEQIATDFKDNSSLKTTLIELKNNYNKCLALTDKFSQKINNALNPGTTSSPTNTSCIAPTDPSGDLNAKDFMEMSNFAKYIAVSLENCTKNDQQACNDISEKDKRRLVTILTLNMKGSTGPEKSIDSTTVHLSELPDKNRLLLNSGSESACFTFSDISSITKVTGGQDRNNLYCIFDTNNSPGCATARLLNKCMSNNCNDITDCKKFLPSKNNLALLSPYKTQTMFLQTMYWNLRDRGENIGWERISPEELDYMNKVYTNQNTSGDRKCETSIIEQNTTNTNSQTKVCRAEGGLGWAVCGIAELLSNGFDSGYNMLNNMMKIKPEHIIKSNENSDSVVYQIWRTVTNIANILMMLVLIAVVFSQVTGYGFQNYSIKVMLPRLLVAVILVNLSFTALRLAIDISNLLGSSIYDQIMQVANIGSQLNNSPLVSNTMTAGWQGIFETVGDILVFIILTALWGVSAFVQLIILSFRDMILILTIISTPLIIVFYLFPNMKKTTSLWMKGFTFSLAFYPVVAFVFGLGHLGFLISNSEVNGFIDFLASRTALIVPMLFSPYLLYQTGRSIPLIGNMLGKTTNRVRSFFSRNDKASPGSIRARRRYRKNQANHGNWSGNAWLHPLLAGRNRLAQATQGTRIYSQQHTQNTQDNARTRSNNAQNMSLEDADSVISAYTSSTNPRSVRRDIARRKSNHLDQITREIPSDSAIILTASLAQLLRHQEMSDAADIRNFLDNLALARRLGASQSELQSTFNQAIEAFESNDDWAALGELNGTANYYADHNLEYGENTADWNGAMLASRTEATRRAMRKRVLERDRDNQNNKRTLDSSVIGAGSLAEQVFKNEFNEDEHFESEVREQFGSMSIQTVGRLDGILNGGLVHDALTANLNQEQINSILNSSSLSPSEITELQNALFNIKGTHNDALNVPSANDINIDAIREQLENRNIRTSIDPVNYPNLVGWSFRNVTFGVNQ